MLIHNLFREQSLITQLRLASNSQSSSISLLNTVVTGMCHHAQLNS